MVVGTFKEVTLEFGDLVPYTFLFIIKDTSFSEKQTIVAQWLGPNLKILSNSFGAFILFVFILLSEIIIFPSK